jgi:hypothetical protein
MGVLHSIKGQRRGEKIGNISKSTSSILQIIDDVKDLLAKKNHPLLAKRQMDLTQTYNYYDAQLVHYADAYIKHDTVTGRLTLEVGNDNGTFNVYQGVCSNHQSSDVYSLVGRNAKGLTLWIVGQVKSKDFIVQVLHAFNDREEFQWAGYNYMTPKKK